MGANDDKLQELSQEELGDVSGGMMNLVGTFESLTAKGKTAYCKVCGAQLLYIGQERVKGGNTGVYKCTNACYKSYGRNCPEYNKIKYNDDVVFR